ncbi:UNVERIFIED_CONTAM: zinc finger protein [Trichonephila clavipes]
MVTLVAGSATEDPPCRGDQYSLNFVEARCPAVGAGSCKICKKTCSSVFDTIAGKCSDCFPKYVCQFCPYVTYNKSNFSRHMMRHTGERPFTCKLCDKGFITNYNLNYHLKQFHRIAEE